MKCKKKCFFTEDLVGQIWPVKILKWHALKLILGSPISILKCFFPKKLIPHMIFSGCKKMWAKLDLDTFVSFFVLTIIIQKIYKYYQSVVYLNTIMVHKNFSKIFHN